MTLPFGFSGNLFSGETQIRCNRQRNTGLAVDDQVSVFGSRRHGPRGVGPDVSRNLVGLKATARDITGQRVIVPMRVCMSLASIGLSAGANTTV